MEHPNVQDHLRKMSCKSKENVVSSLSIQQKNGVIDFR